MKTKALLLGAVASIAFAGTAHAAGWYIGIEAGLSSTEDMDAVGTYGGLPTTGALSVDNGWALIGTVGHELGPNWRIEGELGYRANETDTGGYIDISELSLMVNVLYDIPLSPSLDFSVGLGAGWDQTTFEFAGLEVDDSDIAWQAILGLDWALGPQTDLTFRYRYFNAGGASLSAGAGIATIDFDDVTKHTVTAGVRFKM